VMSRAASPPPVVGTAPTSGGALSITITAHRPNISGGSDSPSVNGLRSFGARQGDSPSAGRLTPRSVTGSESGGDVAVVPSAASTADREAPGRGVRPASVSLAAFNRKPVESTGPQHTRSTSRVPLQTTTAATLGTASGAPAPVAPPSPQSQVSVPVQPHAYLQLRLTSPARYRIIDISSVRFMQIA